MTSAPRWRRRKTARPDEIEAAALAEFAARGFAAAKLETIARNAGLSKASLYVYYPNKTDLFRAVVAARAVPNIESIAAAVAALDAPFAVVARQVLIRMAGALAQPLIRRLAKTVIAEGGNFPEIAKLWHDEVVNRALILMAGLIQRGQTKGEVREGEPRLMAMSVVGPMLLGMSKPIHVLVPSVTARGIVNLSALASIEAGGVG